jgi:glycosyltransferase involved in cell wall biosynthesis
VNILVIGKYPPIEGGVSAYTFWLTRSLADQGHSVYVITNASEGEVSLSQMHYGADSSWLGANGGPGNLQVFQTTPLRPNSFIPFAQPYGTKLFGLSISVLEQHHCDVILSWYFEPYGFVAALVGLAKHRPTIIRRAGSDLGRLSVHPDLNAGLPEALLQDVRRINSKTFTEDVFTIGMYGKVGATKGSFDLIDALIKVAAAGQEFVFLTLSCDHREVLQAYYEAIVKSPALAERSWILPPIALYRVPAFLQRCSAVCFLERHFPISFHGSQIPREIRSSGACLVLSRAVAEKPWYRGNLVDDRNAVIIADPTDKDSLANRLSELISDLDRTCSIGHQGRRLFEFWNEDCRPLKKVRDASLMIWNASCSPAIEVISDNSVHRLVFKRSHIGE